MNSNRYNPVKTESKITVVEPSVNVIETGNVGIPGVPRVRITEDVDGNVCVAGSVVITEVLIIASTELEILVIGK